MSPEVLSQLERLNALRESGALTEAEFQETKGRLLSEQADSLLVSAPLTPLEVIVTPGVALPVPEPDAPEGNLLGVTMAQASATRATPTGWPAAPMTNVQAADRDELRRAGLRFKRYPVWFVVVLSVLTVGIFPIFWVNHWHGIMPKRRTDDPSTARAIGFMFIPLFNLYWNFESRLRLGTRLNEEFQAANLNLRAPNQLVLWWTITNMIPYVGFVSWPIMGAIAAGQLQSQVNALAAFDDEWYRTQGAPGPHAPLGFAGG